jgi:hypothetical protein
VGGNEDYARIYVSNDRTHWVLIWENPEEGTTDNQWTPVAYDLSPIAAREKTVYIRFSMGPTGSAERSSGWNIDDLELTSNPVYPAEGTVGTEVTIHGGGFGAKKGKALIGSTPLTVLSWASGTIHCQLNKALDPGLYDVAIVPSASTKSSMIIEKMAFAVKPPEIYSVELVSVAPWDEVVIHGKFFGVKKGKVSLAYVMDGKPKTRKCSVVSWTVTSQSEEGDIVVNLPKGMITGSYDLIVTNSVGSDTVTGLFTFQ